MRGISTSWVLAALLVAGGAEARRKTLAWGPNLPHASFTTTSASSHLAARSVPDAPSCPYAAAHAFLDSHLPKAASQGSSYVVRPDSYTDKRTGITHVYVDQLLNGIPVADGHVNLNVRDGRVISFGNSFFNGPAPAPYADSGLAADPHREYCAYLGGALEEHSLAQGQSQVVLGDNHPALEDLTHLHDSNCGSLGHPPLATDSEASAQSALLAFLAHATPDSGLAASLRMDPHGHLNELTAHVDPEDKDTLRIGGAPGAVSDVKARVVYVQVPDGNGGVGVELVHRFEVEMQDNWYEAYVSTSAPHRIISVVDWASDAPTHSHQSNPARRPRPIFPPGELNARVKGVGRPSLPTIPIAGLGPESFISAEMAAELGALEHMVEEVVEHVVEDAIEGAHVVEQLLEGGAEAFREALRHSHLDSVAPVPPRNQIPEIPLASYKVFPWTINDPEEAESKVKTKGDLRSLQPERVDSLASPAGWHALPYELDPSMTGDEPSLPFWRQTNTTWGNNVFAHENWEGRNAWMYNSRPVSVPGESKGAKGGAFDFEYNPKAGGTPEERMEDARGHIDATVTQLFYTANMAHDLFYRYGFDEVSGNFQQYNFGRGGREGDAVIANAQDGSGMNNANFMTPPDGQNGRCRMYLWNTANPYRDGDLEAGIVVHELAHGLSTRLTGGPLNSGCLGWGESGGMGEGWGDFLATTIRSEAPGKDGLNDYAMGAWAANRPNGIRNYPYSLDNSTNPSTYKTLDKPGYWGVHAIGEVWAEILWVVEDKLVEKHGWAAGLFPPDADKDGRIPESAFDKETGFYRHPDTLTRLPAHLRASPSGKADGEQRLVPKHGNTLLVQLVIDGMKLQKCSPGFTDARDAIIQADEVLTGGENTCELWAGFAERGLGYDARVDGRTPWGGGVRTNGYKVSPACRGEEDPTPEPEPEDPEDPDCGPFGCW